jgi:hypothetical protein
VKEQDYADTLGLSQARGAGRRRTIQNAETENQGAEQRTAQRMLPELRATPAERQAQAGRRSARPDAGPDTLLSYKRESQLQGNRGSDCARGHPDERRSDGMNVDDPVRRPGRAKRNDLRTAGPGLR